MPGDSQFDPELATPGSAEDLLLRRLDPRRLPRHVAIIMDGNGRWARSRNLPRVAGHRAGIESVRETVEASARLGIDVLTLYAFSRENWSRPRAEVRALMALIREYVRKELRTLLENGIRLNVIGRPDELPDAVRRELDRAVESTAAQDRLLLNIALSYGGRSEIVDACRALIREGVAPEDVDEAAIERRLYTAGQPDPDLLIRTSGELRVSNFLPWQIAYSEIWITDTLWPDFRRADLFRALLGFQSRERRFGGVDPVDPAGEPAAARG
jgi:undecaprenyl diphosphate synthase